MKKRLLLISMFVLWTGGMLSSCGGNSNKHVEMSDRVREEFIDDMKDYELENNKLFLGRDGRFSSAAILNMEVNGAPVILCKNTTDEGYESVWFLYRDASGFFDDYQVGIFDPDEVAVYFNMEKKRLITLVEEENRKGIQVLMMDATVSIGEALVIIAEGYGYESLDYGMSTIRLFGEGGKKNENDFDWDDENAEKEYVEYNNSIETITFDTLQEFEDYIEKEFLGKDAIAYMDLMSGDDVLTTTAELLDAWEEY